MNHAIILAAGLGERMKSGHDKLLMAVAGKPLIYYTLMIFNDHPEIDSITLVANRDNRSIFGKIIKQYHFSKIRKIIEGGKSRQESFARGFKSLPKSSGKDDIVLSHNAANPLVSAEEISAAIKSAKENGACIVGHFISSTLKEIDSVHIVKTHDRKKFFAAETPQAAHYDLFRRAIQNAEKSRLTATDEAFLLESINQKVIYLPASENNFKITTRADYLRLRAAVGEVPEDYRVGIGQDSHMFEQQGASPCPPGSSSSAHARPPAASPSLPSTTPVPTDSPDPAPPTPHPAKPCLTLAGLALPSHPKLQANSDGDVILHAIFNAISQAVGDMSLGFYADAACEKGVKDSRKYLEIILKKVRRQKFQINSLGLMLECKTPKIDPLSPKLKKSLSEILDLPVPRIGITATSGENLTMFGAGLGIQCFAIVSLVKLTAI